MTISIYTRHIEIDKQVSPKNFLISSPRIIPEYEFCLRGLSPWPAVWRCVLWSKSKYTRPSLLISWFVTWKKRQPSRHRWLFVHIPRSMLTIHTVGLLRRFRSFRALTRSKMRTTNQLDTGIVKLYGSWEKQVVSINREWRKNIPANLDYNCSSNRLLHPGPSSYTWF